MNKDTDFINSLKSKDAALKAEREALIAQLTAGNERLVALNGAIAGIDQLLKLEGVGTGLITDGLFQETAITPSEIALADVLKSILADRKLYTVLQLEALVKARGYDFGEKSPQRAIGFTLMGLQRGGKFEKNELGQWKYVG